MSLFRKGIKDGLPIAIGYLPLSFTLGVNTATANFSLLDSFGMSASFTGTGQMTLLGLMAQLEPFFGVFFALLVLNLRNIVMSLALTQRINPKLSAWRRILMGVGNTDEVFALTIRQKGEISSGYFIGVTVLPWVSWLIGGVIGGVATNLVPQSICNALGMSLFAMIIAAVAPAIKESKTVLTVAGIAAVLSCTMTWIEPIKVTLKSSGILVIGSIFSAVLMAFLRPIEVHNIGEEPEKEASAE